MEVLIILLILIVIIGYLFSRIRIIQQSTCVIIERLGTFNRVCHNGVHYFLPLVDRPVRKISLKEQVMDFPPQPVITRDNVTIQIDTVIYFQVTDPKLYTYGVNNPLNAIENITATTLRNIIGELELDESLTSRDIINSKMRSILDEASDPWGVKINRVELKNILPPMDIQQAMEKQMRAEREKREAILIAEGEKISTITRASGQKESIILNAEANKEAAIREAEGKAEAIRIVKEAEAQGLNYLKDVNVDQALLSLKALETLSLVADGKATKIIIPSEIQNLAGLLSGLNEVVKEDNK